MGSKFHFLLPEKNDIEKLFVKLFERVCKLSNVLPNAHNFSKKMHNKLSESAERLITNSLN